MRAIDTNVIVRYITGDEPDQAAAARAALSAGQIFISTTVLLESEWVLRSAYGFAPAAVIAALRKLAGLPGVTLEDPALAARALDWSSRGMDFADALHLGSASHCTGFLSFDQRLARHATAMETTPVSHP
ncbi:type II toxin-antitoxin system VapC family toxin [Sandaracinobacteroides saxicola]|uniref:Ribonuclease VapC n=1 Tax=Sandaracinobacteroides saxicola TaxID=2759707 RepID=A0A7G5IIF5_9SPHN|nr:type II toxin-antitoxin system VapC family toxin [Sandaracinobacteroides saxicola]QMW23147.1 type II toxin-antitoxin system VapC family toxin [Sandaracinobacteroides saxicola]